MLDRITEAVMIGPDAILALQQDQFRHDQRNHSDIACLSKPDRLKHYGLHFAKYVGRLARQDEPKSLTRTVADTGLICLSAANTLHQRLDKNHNHTSIPTSDSFKFFVDAVGRFADACEKQDHLEEFITQARDANRDIFTWILHTAEEHEIDFLEEISLRRADLKERAFYIKD